MTVNILACPECKSLILPDTAQCPNCHYVFDERRATTAEPARPVGRAEAPEEEVPCPGCNELVRKGLVRCWNCGTFMQQEIADSYRKMQISPPKVIYSDAQATTDQRGSSVSTTDSGRLIDEPDAHLTDDDEADFEVDDEMVDEADEADFDLGASEPPTFQNEIVQSAPMFAAPVEPVEESKKAPAAGAKAGKDAKAADAKAAKPTSNPEFANEFEKGFGADDPA